MNAHHRVIIEARALAQQVDKPVYVMKQKSGHVFHTQEPPVMFQNTALMVTMKPTDNKPYTIVGGMDYEQP